MVKMKSNMDMFTRRGDHWTDNRLAQGQLALEMFPQANTVAAEIDGKLQPESPHSIHEREVARMHLTRSMLEQRAYAEACEKGCFEDPEIDRWTKAGFNSQSRSRRKSALTGKGIRIVPQRPTKSLVTTEYLQSVQRKMTANGYNRHRKSNERNPVEVK